MTKIALIRHGETAWNAMGKIQGKTDTDLNDKGIQQAKCCGVYLSKVNWNLLFTSPLWRAKETSVMISNYFDVNMKVMDEFAEKDYGEAVGFSLENQDNYQAYGESPNLFNQRVMRGIEKILGKTGEEKIIIVTHGDVIQTIITTLFSLKDISGKGHFPIKNGSITIIEFSNNTWILHSLNQTNHLN